ncbi:MAG: hypothetical protein ACI4O9_04840 [Akkermansia sp.]
MQAVVAAAERAMESPNMPKPSPMRRRGSRSVTQVFEALLAAAWQAPWALRITSVSVSAPATA